MRFELELRAGPGRRLANREDMLRTIEALRRAQQTASGIDSTLICDAASIFEIMRAQMPSSRDALVSTAEYVVDRMRLEKLSNDELSIALLHAAPVAGQLSDLIEIAVERLSPGLIEKLDDPSEQ